MDQTAFDDFIKNRYNTELLWYDNKSIGYKKTYRTMQWIMIIFSSLTPILILISDTDEKLIPVIVSLLVVITSTAIQTFKLQENWLNYRKSAENMRQEYSIFKTSTGYYSDIVDKEKYFVEQIEGIISRENSNWLKFSKKKQKNT